MFSSYDSARTPHVISSWLSGLLNHVSGFHQRESWFHRLVGSTNLSVLFRPCIEARAAIERLARERVPRPLRPSPARSAVRRKAGSPDATRRGPNRPSWRARCRAVRSPSNSSIWRAPLSIPQLPRARYPSKGAASTSWRATPRIRGCPDWEKLAVSWERHRDT